jgi:PRTRC genetic system protein A
MFVHYHIAKTSELPPITAPLYEYIVAGNGVFKRAQRDVMSAMIPVSSGHIRGLATMEPEFIPNFGKVPKAIVNHILDVATEAARQNLESLFYLNLRAGIWQLEIPKQIQTYSSVAPVEKGAGSPYDRAIIEIHSHHRMSPHFSLNDDKDETGFRIFGVIGHLNPAQDYWPMINLRLGVYGDWWALPADRILEMPLRLRDYNSDKETDENEVIDAYTREQAIADGVLLDVTATAKEAGFSCPIALTSAVYEMYVKVPEGVEEADMTGRLWDILMVLRQAARKSSGKQEILFKLSVQRGELEMEVVTLKAVCGSDDDGEMCLTVMLPEED